MAQCPFCSDRVRLLGRNSLPVTANIATVMTGLEKCEQLHQVLSPAARETVPKGLGMLLTDGRKYFDAWHDNAHGRHFGPLPFSRYQGWLRASAALAAAYESLGDQQRRADELQRLVAQKHRGTHVEQTDEGVRLECGCGAAVLLAHGSTDDEVNAAVDEHLRALMATPLDQEVTTWS